MQQNCGKVFILHFSHFVVKHFTFYDWSRASVTLEIRKKAVGIRCRSVMRSQFFIYIGQVDSSTSDCIRWWVLINVKWLSCLFCPMRDVSLWSLSVRSFFDFLLQIAQEKFSPASREKLKLMHHQGGKNKEWNYCLDIYQSNLIVHGDDARSKFPIWVERNNKIANLLVFWTLNERGKLIGNWCRLREKQISVLWSSKNCSSGFCHYRN